MTNRIKKRQIQELSDIRVLMADSSLVLAFQRGDKDAQTILISRFSDFLDQIAQTYSGTGLNYGELRELAFNCFLKTTETWSRDTEPEYAEFALKSICGRLESFIVENADHLDIEHLQTDFHLRLVKIAAQLSHDIPNEAELPGLVYKMVNRLDYDIDMADETVAENVRLYAGVDIEMVGKLLAAQSLACYLQPAGIAGPFERIAPPEASAASNVSCPEIAGDSDFDFRAALDEINLDRF